MTAHYRDDRKRLMIPACCMIDRQDPGLSHGWDTQRSELELRDIGQGVELHAAWEGADNVGSLHRDEQFTLIFPRVISFEAFCNHH